MNLGIDTSSDRDVLRLGSMLCQNKRNLDKHE